MASAVALILLLVWPRLPTGAIVASTSTLRETAQIVPGDHAILITDMPSDAAEALSLAIEDQSGAEVDLIATSGVHSGDSPLPAVVSRATGTADASHVIVWAGWGDLWASRLGFRAAATDALDTLRDRFPSASLTVIGPIPSQSGDAPRYGPVDVMLGRAARSADVSYISGLSERWPAPEGDEVSAANDAIAGDLTGLLSRK